MTYAIGFDIFARDHASQAFDKVGKHSDSLVSKVGDYGKKAVLGLSTAVVGLGTAAAVMGIKTAAGNEQAQIAFTTMLGSGKKASAFLKDLQQFAAQTPFEFPELQTAASSLISAGVNANKVIPIMRTLGDVTSGMGTGSEGVKRATVALQQMNAAGRITGEDLNQLRDAGIPVYDLLSKATGKSKAEVVKLAQAGKLGSKELGQMMKALETGKGLERFSGLMDKQSKSLTGMWSTVKDTLGQGLAKAVTPVIPLLKDGLGKASDYLAQVLPKVSDGLEGFIHGAQTGTGVGGKFVNVLQTTWHTSQTVVAVGAKVVGYLNEHRGATIAATAVLVGLVAVTKVHAAVMAVQAAGGLLKYIQATKIVTAVTRTWTAVQWLMNAALTANPVGIVIVAVAALGAAVVLAYKKSETFRKIVKGAFDAVGAAARFMWNNVVAPVIRFLIGAFISVTGFYATLLRGLSKVPGFGWARGAANALQNVANKAAGIRNNIHSIPSYKKVTVDIWQYKRTAGSSIVVNGQRVNAGLRAEGGPVRAGQPYIVGEYRRELFVPDRDGQIIPRVAKAMLFDRGGLLPPGTSLVHNATGRPEVVVPPGAGMFGGTVVFQVMLDGKVLGEYLIDNGRVVQQGLLKVKRQQGGRALGIA